MKIKPFNAPVDVKLNLTGLILIAIWCVLSGIFFLVK